jgi:hypothetical protein
MRTTKLLKAVEAQSIVSHEAHPHLSIAHDSTIAAPTSHSMDERFKNVRTDVGAQPRNGGL